MRHIVLANLFTIQHEPLKLKTVWNSGPWENVEGCSYRRAPPLRRWLDACLFMQMPIGKEWRSNDKDGGSGQAGDFTALLWRKQGKWKTLTECGTDRYFIPKLRSLFLSIRHTFFILRDDCLSKNTLYCNSELHSHFSVNNAFTFTRHPMLHKWTRTPRSAASCAAHLLRFCGHLLRQDRAWAFCAIARLPDDRDRTQLWA